MHPQCQVQVSNVFIEAEAGLCLQLDKPETANTVAQGIVDAATTVLASDRETAVVVLGILPRGDKAVEAPALRYILPNKYAYTRICTASTFCHLHDRASHYSLLPQAWSTCASLHCL